MSADETIVERARLEDMCRSIGSGIGPLFENRGFRFLLLGFGRSPDNWTTWVSNVERKSMIEALREFADVLELEADVPSMHGQGPGPGHSGPAESA